MKRKNIPYIFLIMLVIAFLFSSISFAQSVRNSYNYNFLLSPFIIDPLSNYYGFLNHSYYNTSRSGYESIANTSSLANTWPLFSALNFYSPIINYDALSLNTGLSALWHLFSPISYNLSTTSSSSSNGLPDDSQTASGLSEKQSEFVSVGTSTQNIGSGGSTGYGGVYGGNYAGGYGGVYGGGYGYATYSAAPTDATPETPEETGEDLELEIEEADIIKIDGTDLYILNQYRGLVICDISQPESPFIAGRVAITGTPDEMYIRDGRAYIIVNKSTATSTVTVVDVTTTSQPYIIGTFDLNGEVTDSRIVGHILYVVSSETIFECESNSEGYQTCYPSESEIQRNIYIASINVSDPENIHQMYRVDFEGTAHHIHVSEIAIFIASTPENSSTDTTTISYIDISNIDGSMIMRGSIELPGTVKDEFKMDYYNSYFRVCTYEEWGASNLYVIDTSDPDILQQVGGVVLGLGEQLFATRFEEERAYMVTFRRIDPLWVIDLSDPTNPRITAELEVTGWSTHIEAHGDRLIALGVDDTGGQKVCVSLFNVADPESPFLIKRISFSGSEGSSYGWSTSVAYDDIHAFTILEELGMILLPYFTKYYDEEDQRHTDNRLQIIDYTPDDLTARGWVSQKGSVLRSRSFSDYLFSISVEELQVIDASIRDEPQVISSLTLARNIIDFIPLTNGYGVQVIYEDDCTYLLRTVALTAPEDGDAANELELSYENDPFIIGNNNMVYVIERNSNPTKLQIYDFNEISNPCSRGSLDISGSYANLRSLLGGKAITYSDYSSNEIVQIRDDVLAFYRTNSYYYPYYYGTYPYSGYYPSWPSSNNCEIIVVHLSDPDNPITSSSIPINVATPRGLFSKNEILYFSYNINTIEDDLARPQSKYYLGRIDLSDPDNPIELNPVNIPGFCMGLSNSGEYAYTINDEWVQNSVYYYSKAYSFNVVKIIDDQAYLYDKIDLDQRSTNAVISNGFAYLSESGYYGYGYGYYGGYYGGGYYGSSPGWVIINLADPENLVKYEHTFGGNIFAARSGKAFVSMSNEVSCFNVTDPEHPQPEELRSGNNKYDQITFFNNAAYLPLGYYGLWVKSL